MRRVIKEIVRHMEQEIAQNVDFILIVRKPAVSMSYTELDRSIHHVLRKGGLLKNSKPHSPRRTTISKKS